MVVKARYWQAIMYPENMIDDWKDRICELFQLPFCYCVHDKDIDKKEDARKEHVHIILVYGNTTTEKSALKVFKCLEKDGLSAIPNDKIQQVNSIRNAYDYLIHDTEDSRAKGKYQYEKSERICGNGFDIGQFEQISLSQKNDMAMELCNLIIDKVYSNFADFYCDVISNYDTSYFEVLKSYSGLFERLTKANWQKAFYRKNDE